MVPRRATKTAVSALAGVAGVELVAEPAEVVGGDGGVADLVAEVVGDAAEGVDVAEVLAEVPGEEEA